MLVSDRYRLPKKAALTADELATTFDWEIIMDRPPKFPWSRRCPLLKIGREAVKRFRPPLMSLSTPPQILIDDNFLCAGSSSNNCFTYTGAQWGASTVPEALDQTLHGLGLSVNFAANAWSVRFSGTAINVFGHALCDAPPCQFDLQVDGGPVRRESSPSYENIVQLTADQLGNQSQNHTLTVSNMNTHALTIDYAIVDAPLDTLLQGQSAGQLWADLTNTAIAYHGAWNKVFDATAGAEVMQSNTVGDSLSFDFVGYSLVVIGKTSTTVQGNVSLEVTVDNDAPSPQNFISDGRGVSSNSFYSYYNSNSSLAPAQHRVEITVTEVTEQQVFDFRGMLYLTPGNTLRAAIASNATATPPTSSSPSSPSSSPSSPSHSNHSSGSNQKSHPNITGPVVGGVVGGALMTALLLLILWMRRRSQKPLPSRPITPFEQEDGTAPVSQPRVLPGALTAHRFTDRSVRNLAGF
ncbi:hypothetical protein C8R46DRAFT_468545 [Mycena filopes]|nr:hypothetical protein C8R46DRAFT_468545 [Mycena filopes]